MAKKKTKKTSELASNRKTRHDYFVEDSLEAGLIPVGTEVKPIHERSVNLTDAYAPIQKGEIYVEDMHITPYEEGNHSSVDPLRKRKLLLHKEEIQKLKKSLDRKGKALVPLKLYLVRGKTEMELGLVRGRKFYDKRQALRKKKINKKLRDFIKY